MKTENLEREVRRFFVEDVRAPSGDCVVVVAVSGGPDSTALLHLLYGLRGELGLDLHAAHFDHRLRVESADDADFVRKTAAELGIPAAIESAGAKEISRRRGSGLEDAARRARYRFLERTRVKVGGRFVAVAHNLEDQAETVLLRLFRGTGTAGAGAMRPIDGTVIRPLLGVAREAILDYCGKRGVEYRTDRTNAEAIADRNRLRLSVMPELRRIWPGVDLVLARDAEVFAQDARALEWAAETALKAVRTSSSEDHVELSKRALRGLPPQVIRLVLRRASMAAGRAQPPSKVRVDAAMDFCLSRRGGGFMNLGAGVEVLRGHETLLFKREGHEPERIIGDVGLEPPCEVDIPGICTTLRCRVIGDSRGVESVRNSIPTNDADSAFLDFATVDEPLRVRRRRSGDRLRPFGRSGDITLARYLIERRIPSWKRDSVPIVAGASGIVWVAGLDIDDRHRVTDRTSNVLELRIVDGPRRPDNDDFRALRS